MTSKQPFYIMVPRIESGETEYSDYVKECLKDNRIEEQKPLQELIQKTETGG